MDPGNAPREPLVTRAGTSGRIRCPNNQEESAAAHEALPTARRIALFLVSTTAHFLALVILVMLPLIFIGAVPVVDLISFLIAAPEPPPALTPPAPPIPREEAVVSQPIERKDFEFPDRIPDRIAPPDPEPVPVGRNAGTITGFPGNLAIGSPVGVSSGTLGNLDLENSVAAPLPPPPKPTPKKDPLRRVSEIQASRLIRRVEPIYPHIAIASRVSGIVVLDVRVDEDGNVENIRVFSGHPLLREAAVEAVRQWKYSPTILNGEPVPVVATVTVIFTLR